MRSCIVLPLATAALLAACSQEGSESADDFAARVGGSGETGPTPQMTTTPTPTAAPDGKLFAPGSWNVTEDASGARAAFGPADSEARLMLACDRTDRRIAVALAGNADAPQEYRIIAGGQTTRLSMEPTGEALPTLAARAPANAPVFTALAQPGASAEVIGPDGKVLRIPTSSAINRVIAACS